MVKRRIFWAVLHLLPLLSGYLFVVWLYLNLTDASLYYARGNNFTLPGFLIFFYAGFIVIAPFFILTFITWLHDILYLFRFEGDAILPRHMWVILLTMAWPIGIPLFWLLVYRKS